MTRLSIYLLGPFEVSLDGDPVTRFETEKVRALLAYLAAETDRPHRREFLAEMLWPGRPEGAARANLRHALRSLRRAIGDYDAAPPFLLITRDTVQFDRASDAWIDAIAFADLLPTNQPIGPEIIYPLERAVVLYREAFLKDVSIGDSAMFEEWATLKRERFGRQVLDALHKLTEGYTQLREYEHALEHAWRQVEMEPWSEPAQRQVMRLLAYTGRRGEALAQYEACRHVLAEELGLEPEEETVALYKRIRDGEEALTPTCVLPHNLPAPLTPFVGRDVELAQLKDRLLDPACRLLTLVGPGGIGKTRLALEVAEDLVAESPHSFSHGVYLVPLAPLPSPAAIVPAVARAVGYHFASGRAPVQQLLDYLRNKRMLLILDNFEHLLSSPPPPTAFDPTPHIAVRPDPPASQGALQFTRGWEREGTELVVDVLRAAPDVKMMITSRTGLNLQGEHLFPIVGMDVPPPEAPATLSLASHSLTPGQLRAATESDGSLGFTQYSAVKLFLQGARRVRPGFEPTVSDLAAIARICRLVAGMPLGILLAAAWVGVLVPAEVATQIERSFDFLETDWRDLPERLRSMRAVFDHSWNLLTERERQVFQRLSVFRGSFTPQAAQQVTDASLAELRALATKSLLHRTSAGRYQLHELLQQYAADKLCQSDRRVLAEQLSGAWVTSETVHDRHSVYYTAALQRWNVEFAGPRQQAFLARAEADAENVRAAWDWAVERAQVERLDRALEGLEDLYWSCGRYQEGEANLRAAADRLCASAALDAGVEVSEYRLRVLARILAWEGNFCRLLGHRDRASELQQQGLTILERTELADQDTRREKALLFWLMGHGALMNSPERGQYLYEQSLALCRELDDRPGTARALISLGTVNVFVGALDEAKARYEEALELYQALDDPRCIVRALASLAEVALFQGRFDEADRLARQSVGRCEELGNQPESAFARLMWGETLVAQGQFSEAQSALETSLAIYDDLGHHNYIASAQAELGSVSLHLGRYEKARAHAQLALDLAREHGPLFRVGFALTVLGCVALVQKASHKARRLLQESIAVYRGIGPRSGAGLGWTQAILGYAARELEDRDQARQHVHEALQTGTETGMIEPLLWALPVLALLMVEEGKAEQAVELWALASSCPLVANSHWFEDMAGRRIAAVAAALPTDFVAKAQEQGQTRDLRTAVAELLAKQDCSVDPDPVVRVNAR
jgi:predicted ATPase/DNA-binding SARP family transcriptional activator